MRNLLVSIVFCLAAGLSYADRTACSPSQTDVKNVILGVGTPSCGTPYTTPAGDGETVTVPAGSADWTGTYITISKAIKLIGAGINATIITDNITPGTNPETKTIFDVTASTNLYYPRISGFSFIRGSESRAELTGGAIRIEHSVPKFRVDHCQFLNLRNTGMEIYAERGVVDHCDFQIQDDDGMKVHGKDWGGPGGFYGDLSWSTPVLWGSDHFVFGEDNTYTNNFATSRGRMNDSDAGARVVYRYNTYNNDRLGGHGTESTARFRGTRAFEIYGNTINCTTAPWGIAYRSGNGVIFENTANGITNYFAFGRDYREADVFNNIWSGANGLSNWDKNDPVGVYLTGTHTGANGAQKLEVTGAGWTTDQWIGYTVINTDAIDVNGNARFSTITSNTDHEIFYLGSSQGSPLLMTFNTGQHYEIRRVLYGMDHPGAGLSDAMPGGAIANPTPTFLNQDLPARSDPIYCWNNTFKKGVALVPTPALYVSIYPGIQEGRDFINGSAKPGYTPYTYPHPLVGGGGGIAPPANLRIAHNMAVISRRTP